MTDTASCHQQFSEQVLKLCRLLEGWREQEKHSSSVELDPYDFPNTNWRAAAQSLVFYGLGGLVVLIQSWLQFAQSIPTLILYMILLAICGGTASVLLLYAQGMFERQFWRAAGSIFRKTDNFPFTSLVRRTERDLTMTQNLCNYPAAVVGAVEERLGILEGDLRERLTLLGGNSAVPTVLSLVGAAWGAWKSFSGDLNALTIAALAAAIGVLWITAYAFKLRFSVLELTRCRALLSLEIARRRHEKGIMCES